MTERDFRDFNHFHFGASSVFWCPRTQSIWGIADRHCICIFMLLEQLLLLLLLLLVCRLRTHFGILSTTTHCDERLRNLSYTFLRNRLESWHWLGFMVWAGCLEFHV